MFASYLKTDKASHPKDTSCFYTHRLIELNAHIGYHQSNQFVDNFILGKRNQITMYNPAEIQTSLLRARALLQTILNKQGSVWWTSSQKEHRPLVELAAHKTHQESITQLWKSGHLTNFSFSGQRPARRSRGGIALQLDSPISLPQRKPFPETSQRHDKHPVSISRNLPAQTTRLQLPDVMIILDANTDSQAIREANLLHIPVIAIVDTTTSPAILDQIVYKIYGNPRSIAFIYYFIGYLVSE